MPEATVAPASLSGPWSQASLYKPGILQQAYARFLADGKARGVAYKEMFLHVQLFVELSAQPEYLHLWFLKNDLVSLHAGASSSMEAKQGEKASGEGTTSRCIGM